jgi:hypothetical protein
MAKLLVKLKSAPPAGLSARSSQLEPLYPARRAGDFGIAAPTGPQWFVVEADGAATGWDVAHQRLAGQLGVAESEILFVEPDQYSRFEPGGDERPQGVFAAGTQCVADPQEHSHGEATGAHNGWHLDDTHSQLATARSGVPFTAPRTRIAHIDTGYAPHLTTPAHLRSDLERNFVEKDGTPGSANDPDNWRLIFDNSGHGVGTLSILAGGMDPNLTQGQMGGAPDAEIVPLRIADTVVLLKTSALARSLDYAVTHECAVASLSMGGVPSRAWAEAVDAAYDAGLCLVAAAGNRVGISPPKTMVYPARYDRVIGVCGVMANGQPYKGLTGTALEGSFGPDSVMGAAMAAYTPNIPWARYGCPSTVRYNGGGTSSATPQVAAAAALWIEKYKTWLPKDWQRVEAVRHALFTSAHLANKSMRQYYGHGILRANAALAIQPVFGLPKSARSTNSWAFLRLLTGLGIDGPSPREEMFNLEIAQRWLFNEQLQALVADPDAAMDVDEQTRRAFMSALIDDPEASATLKRHLRGRYPALPGDGGPRPRKTDAKPSALESPLKPPAPTRRRLRVYAVDPSLSANFQTAGVNETTLRVRWEDDLKAGPEGEYVVVNDVDETGHRIAPVDLNATDLLAQDGCGPSEGNPQFHQQMVYAVAMQTIEHFERALGRPVLWRSKTAHTPEASYVGTLALYPHAMRQANAYYSPADGAVRFGYYEAGAGDPGAHMPGSLVFTCLSHDVIAHEVTHAILDGMHRQYIHPTNYDVLAFHEAFADIVALFQHFTMPSLLETEIARTRGDLGGESILGMLAIQLGQTSSGRGALRSAIGEVVNGVWHRRTPDPAALSRLKTPHERGAVLVAAVFDAFLAIYRDRTSDLIRLATGGSGVLRAGAIPPDLVARLANEASKTASHVLTICIRALDYLPPVDVTFFEYLRALLTADTDIVAEDPRHYRVAFVEAFRRHGIYPLDMDDASAHTVRTLSVDTLLWRGVGGITLTPKEQTAFNELVAGLREFAQEVDQRLGAGSMVAGKQPLSKAALKTLLEDISVRRVDRVRDRKALYLLTQTHRAKLMAALPALLSGSQKFADALGLDPALPVEVADLRRAMRVGPDGQQVAQLVVMITQRKGVTVGGVQQSFTGGTTVIVDLHHNLVRYSICKNIGSKSRQARTAAYVAYMNADPWRKHLCASTDRGLFAALHSSE